MLMLETYEDNRLRQLYELQAKNTRYYDRQVLYFDWELHIELENEIDKLESVLYARRIFSGKPHQWKGNTIRIVTCKECPLRDICVEWNNYLNKPKPVKVKDDRFKSDASGNKLYKIFDMADNGII
jgi:hypothetical protein